MSDGQVRKRPNLDGYDSQSSKPKFGVPEHLPSDIVFGGFDDTGSSDAMLTRFIGADDWANAGLIKQLHGERGHSIAKSMLIAYGVNGEVQLTQAMANAGLAANDNNFSAAEAAA